MSLQTTAHDLEEIMVEDIPSEHIVLKPISMPMSMDAPVMTVHEVSEPHEEDLECTEPIDHIEVVIEGLGDIPGLDGKLDKEETLEVSEEPEPKDTADVNDAKKSKKDVRWDWEAKGPEGFVVWVQERFHAVPKHSGYDSAGIERAVSYLDKLDSEISKAMRLDLDGDLDANKVEDIRSKIEEGIDRLNDRLDKIKQKGKKKKKKAEESYDLVKEAQKITGVAGIYVTVPLLISRIARVCVNGMVSAGHDIEIIFKNQVKKYKLSDREQAETMQLLSDMGYPLRQDRGFLLDEDVDTRSSDNFDWAASYKS